TKAEKERADENAAEAKQAKDQAEKELHRSEWLLYSNQIASAQRDWDANNVEAAWQSLDASRKSLRGWEYNYLYSLFTQNQRTLTNRSLPSSASFSTDGKRLLVGAYDGIMAWSFSDDRDVLEIPIKGNIGSLNRVAFSPDGKRIAGGSIDGVLNIWDAAT